MIERIIIENFKSIRKLDLELKPINILIGANGAGKSNFLSFFKLNNEIYNQRLQYYISNEIDKFLYFGRKKSNHIYGLIDFDNKYAVNFRIVPKLKSNFSYIENADFLHNYYKVESKDYSLWISIIGQSGNDGEAYLFQEISKDLIENSAAKEYKDFVGDFLQRVFKIYHFHDTGISSPLKQMNELNDNRFLRENGENLASYLYYLQEKHPRDFRLIESQIRSVAPFFDRFDLAPDRLNETQIELLWLEKGSDSYFNAYDLSDGTLRFIALTTLLLQPDLPKTIIIDEPELGLHPFAINKLAAMIKQAAKKGSQVIVSTQSVNLVDNFEPEDVIAVDREDNQSVFKRLKSEDLKEWLEDYTLGDLWNKNIFGARP